MSQESSVQTVLACSQCGRALAPSELVQIAGSWVCADCKPAFLSRVMANGASPLAWRYAGFWIRFAARFIDGLIFTVPILIFAAMLIPSMIRAASEASNPAGGALNPQLAVFGGMFIALALVLLVAVGCYEILMLKYRGATLGKMAFRLRVVRSDGGSLSWGVCFGRFLMWHVVTSGIPYVNAVLMLVSTIMLVVDDQNRALHDRVCDTRVIHKQSVA